METKYKVIIGKIIFPNENRTIFKHGDTFFLKDESLTGKRFPITYSILNKNGYFMFKTKKYIARFIQENTSIFEEIK